MTETSDRSTESLLLIVENFSIPPWIFPFLLSPAVSVRIISWSWYSIWMSVASLVVPGMSDTMTLSSPSSPFRSEDFPAFGLPKKEIFSGVFSSAVFFVGFFDFLILSFLSSARISD